jgi:hypothetical protein
MPRYASSRRLKRIDPTAKLAAADAAISHIQQLLDEVRINHDELRRTLDDLKRDRDEWRGRPSGLQSGHGGGGLRADDGVEKHRPNRIA